jgi:hypothetical protein
MDTNSISAGDLSAEISIQEPGSWCGLSDFRTDRAPTPWLLSPAFTLEHYIGVPTDEPGKIGYEPTESPKTLERVDESECTLTYNPMPCSQVTCTINFKMVEPDIVDVIVAAQTSRADWPLGSLSLFFATIVNAPLMTGVYMRATDIAAKGKKGDGWLHFNGMAARIGRTAHPEGVDHPELNRPPGKQGGYYYSDSSVRFSEPMFVGVMEDKALTVMFPPRYREQVRFTVNPVAPAFGGPAWDFFWVIDDPEPGKEYEIAFRSTLAPFAGLRSALATYEDYCFLTE